MLMLFLLYVNLFVLFDNIVVNIINSIYNECNCFFIIIENEDDFDDFDFFV